MILGITEDKDNNLWMLSYRPPRLLLRISDARVQEEIPMPPMPEGRALATDSRGDIWLGLRNGDLARYQEGHAETFHFEHPPSSLVYQVALSSDGSILGATSYGLIGWSNGKQRTLSARNGLPCDGVNSLVEDNRGDLWLYQKCGLVQIEKSDLQKWWADPNVKLQPRVFDVFDGLRAGIPTPFERSAVRDRDGRLWFANASVMQMVDPAHMVRNLTPPPVHLEQIIADHKMYLPSGGVRLPARTRDVEIDYTALSFRVPQKVRFRYRLEGRDADWQEAGTRRQAFYTDLGPRAYRFRVIASNDSGVWNETGDTLEFSLAPAYYQTDWFRAGCVVAFFATLWGLYRLRLQQISARADLRYTERLEERTRIARELHDTMLQSFQASLAQMQAGRNLLSRQSDRALQAVDDAITMAAGAIAEGRNAVGDLRSSSRNDLAETLKALGDELAASGDTTFQLVAEGPRRELHPAIQDEICRIGGEALRNAFKHARAHHIEADVRYSEQLLRLQIRDDGVGITPEILEGGRSNHFGLGGMRERAEKIGAKLEIWSATGTGTEIALSIPATRAYGSSPSPARRFLTRE
jgi:signal transduction histidine kinase